MSLKNKRPTVLDLDSLLVNQTQQKDIGKENAISSKKNDSQKFRTSIYFSRAIHDKLREIAFAERKTVTDLINEGLDHVLSSRNYPSTSEL